MNLEITRLLPEDFDDASRVWIYQGSRLFSMSEALRIENMLTDFVSSWSSHGTPVKGWASLFFGQFIVLVADETAAGVSGCSTDSSVRLMKHMEQIFRVDFFDRLVLAFVVKEKVQLIPLVQIPYAFKNHFIDGSTIYFNNTVTTLRQLKNYWLIPARKSWLNDDPRFEALIRELGPTL